MTQLVTRCPQCSTSFRITPAQIQKARGAVRCGSCLHIFNAEHNLIEGGNPKPVENRTKAIKRPPQTPAPTQAQLPMSDAPAQSNEPINHQDVAPPSPKTTRDAAQPDTGAAPAAATAPDTENTSSVTPTSVASDSSPAAEASEASSQSEADGLLRFDQAQIDLESEIDDDVLISDDMGNPPAQNDTHLYVAPSTSGHSLFERQLQQQPDEFVDDSDESWAESLLEDDGAEGALGRDNDNTFDNPLSITHEESSVRLKPSHTAATAHNPQNDIPPQGYDDYDVPESFAPDSFATESYDLDTALLDDPGTADDSAIKADRSETIDERDSAHEAFSGRLRAYDSERSALLMGIDPEPVEMATAHHRPWRKRLLWGALCALAAIALAAQIAWLQVDRLSRIQPYRDYYQSACQWLGCQLPTLRDTSKVSAYNLVVRQHPERSDALMVDAIILNSAEFEQPYPALQLSFSDLNDKPVASRRFTPKEYLRGELSGRSIMPPNQPVHLSLELADPGSNAVNYSLVIP